MQTSAQREIIAHDAALEIAARAIELGHTLPNAAKMALARYKELYASATNKDIAELEGKILGLDPNDTLRKVNKRRTFFGRALKWMRGNVASTLVIAYALFVVGSLFRVPWILTFRPYEFFGVRKHPEPVIHWATIFFSPTGQGVSAHLMFEQILLVW